MVLCELVRSKSSDQPVQRKANKTSTGTLASTSAVNTPMSIEYKVFALIISCSMTSAVCSTWQAFRCGRWPCGKTWTQRRRSLSATQPWRGCSSTQYADCVHWGHV